jgi:hypothetical protein
LLSRRIVEEMDRAEMLRYLRDRHLPLRHTFRPRPQPAAGYRGCGFIIDLGLCDERNASIDLLQTMDEIGLRMSVRCMYEHIRIQDLEGHMAVGFLQSMLHVLSGLTIGLGYDEISPEMALIFERFVIDDLQMRYVIDYNSGTYRDVVEAAVSSGDRSIPCLMATLGVQLTHTTNVPGEFHGTCSMDTAKRIIADSLHTSNPSYGLHAMILWAGDQAADRHHVLVMWYVASPEIPIKVS